MRSELSATATAYTAPSYTEPTDEPEDTDGSSVDRSESQDVYGKYEEPAVEDVYCVEITWENLSFTYVDSSQTFENGEWVSNHDAKWEESTGKITIANRSNVAVNANLKWGSGDGYSAVEMSFDGTKNDYTVKIDAATPVTGETTGTARSVEIRVEPSGSLPVGTSNATIGTITVTIQKADA